MSSSPLTVSIASISRLTAITLALLVDEDGLFTVSESLDILQQMAKQVERDWISCPLASFTDLEIGMFRQARFLMMIDKLSSSRFKKSHKINMGNAQDVTLFQHHDGRSCPFCLCFYSTSTLWANTCIAGTTSSADVVSSLICYLSIWRSYNYYSRVRTLEEDFLPRLGYFGSRRWRWSES